MFQFLQVWKWRFKDWWSGKPTTTDRGVPRSPKWPKIRILHLIEEPACAFCGGRKRLEVHHIKPFHIDPTKELDDNNLITLCDKPDKECHLRQGHLGDFKNFNPHIREDCNQRKIRESDSPNLNSNMKDRNN